MIGNEFASIYLIDTDRIFRRQAEVLLNSVNRQVASFESAGSFFREFDPSGPACVLVDLQLPDCEGPLIQSRLLEAREWLPVIFTTVCSDMPPVTAAMRAGAWHVLQKPIEPTTLLETVSEALDMAVHFHEFTSSRSEIAARMSLLSKREREVLDLLIQGYSSRAIASQLGNSCWTVEKQRSSLMHKMHAKTVAELAMMYSMAPPTNVTPQVPGLFWWTYQRDRDRRQTRDSMSPLPAAVGGAATLAVASGAN
jgi:FixJ family two-component response regulator